MKRILLVLGIACGALLAMVGLLAPQGARANPVESRAVASSTVVLADYEGALPGNAWQYTSGPVLTIEHYTITNGAGDAKPGQTADTGVISVTTDASGGAASFGQNGLTIDATQYFGISFWFYGTNSGTTYYFELQSGAVDPYLNSQRASFTDNVAGWQQVNLPFTAFSAHFGSFNATDMTAWGIILDGTNSSFMVDDVALITPSDALLADYDGAIPTNDWQYVNSSVLAREHYTVANGAGDAKPGQTADTGVLSVTVTASGGSASFGQEGLAVDANLYEGVSFWFYGTNSGTTYYFEVQSNNTYLQSERAAFTDNVAGWQEVVLPFSSFSANLGSYDANYMTAWAIILDGIDSSFMIDDVQLVEPTVTPPEEDVSLILADYEGALPANHWQYTSAPVLITEHYTITNGAGDAKPGQTADTGVISVTTDASAGAASFGQNSLTIDTTDYFGISFWFYGTNSGTTYAFELQSGAVNSYLNSQRASFTDNVAGWQQVNLPFSKFSAHLGSFDVTDMTAWGIILDGTNSSFLVDDVTLIAHSSALLTDYDGAFPANDWQYVNSAVLVREHYTITNGAGDAKPEQTADTGVISVTVNAASGSASFGQDSLAVDANQYFGISFWFYGTNSGTTYDFEVQSNNTYLQSERAAFTDNVAGWQQVVLPFSKFSANLGSYDPDYMTAWGMILDGIDGSFMLDDIQLIEFTDPLLTDYDGAFPANDWQYVNSAVLVREHYTITNGAGDAKPGQAADTGVISVTVNASSGSASFGQNGLAINATEYEGISFWFYGTNSGATYYFEVQSTNTYLQSERASFTDNVAGWQQVVLPFSSFSANLGSYDAEYMTAWGLILDGLDGMFMVDDLQLVASGGGSVSLDADSYSVTEGQSAVLTIELDAVAVEDVMVDIETSDDTATAGADYTAISETVTIMAGSTSVTVTLATQDDSDDEGNETLNVTLSSPISAVLGSTASAVVTINDDDATGSSKGTIVDDFEIDSLPFADVDGLGLGWVVWQDGGGSIAITATTTADAGIAAVNGKDGTNKVLEIDHDIASWGGLTHAFTNDAVDTWLNQDWSSYESISFWYYGEGDGTTVFFDIMENRNPNDLNDGAERWRHEWTDNTAGWQYVEVKFEDFNRNALYNEAPNDGWSGTEVHGWAFGTLATGDADKRYLDDVKLIPRVTTVDDFEIDSLPFADVDGLGLGWVVWQDGGGSIAITATTTADAGIAAVTGKDGTNKVLEIDHDIVSWGGLTHAFTNEALDTWLNEDWSGYEGICFWYYGEGDGTTVFFDLMENRNPNDLNDGAERWRHEWTDNTAGWQFIQVPFADFNRNALYNEAPNDGWSGEEVHGWAFGTLSTGGADKRYLDDISIYGSSGSDIALSVAMSTGQYDVAEGSTAMITVSLSISSTQDVTVSYIIQESQAIEGRDYVAPSGSVTIPAGDLYAWIEIETIEDAEVEGDESMIIYLDSASVDFGFQVRSRLTIADEDVPQGEASEIEFTTQNMSDDFEGYHSFNDIGANVALSLTEVMSGSSLIREGQDDYEHVAEVTYDTRTSTRALSAVGAGEIATTFAITQDWSSYDNFSFWFYGTGSGQTYTVNVLDNQTSTTANTDPSEWVMVWNDEFDGTAGTPPNPNHWQYELGDGLVNELQGWGNSELQYYTDSTDNSSLDGNGNLAITVLEEVTSTTDLVCWYGPCQYTSARLISKDRMTYEYGRIEARIKVPDGPAGLWPAFWALGTDIDEVGWPQSGEIDIMEYVSKDPYKIFGTIHGPGHSGGNSLAPNPAPVLTDPVSLDYHVYAIEWQPDRIEWFLDGQSYHLVTPDILETERPGSEWVYNHEFFLLLNMAMGGNFGEAVDPSMTFPQTMLVDYIRVYQVPNSSERFEASFVDNKAGWQEINLGLTDEFSRSADQPAGAPDDGMNLTDVWGYTFEFPEEHADTIYMDQIHLANNQMIHFPAFFLQP